MNLKFISNLLNTKCLTYENKLLFFEIVIQFPDVLNMIISNEYFFHKITDPISLNLNNCLRPFLIIQMCHQISTTFIKLTIYSHWYHSNFIERFEFQGSIVFLMVR